MANVVAPFGFRLFQTEGNSVRTRNYTKTAAIIYEGDLVFRNNTGSVLRAPAGSANIVGVAAHYAAADATEIAIIDDPDATYQAQVDSTTAYALADNGLNVDLAAGTAVGTRSGQVINMATAATTATLPFKIIGLAPPINSNGNVVGVNATILVTLNQCERGAGSVGI